jgi:signal peptidase
VPEEDPKREGYLSILKGFIAIGLIIGLIFLAMFAYSGLWPPIVVVESDSMQHSDSRSSIGTIDTGDIVIVQKVRGSQDVATYLEGIANGHKTYGEYGDVVTYMKYGEDGSTPIIHRAICEIVYNETGHGFDIPSLAFIPDDQWAVENEPVKTYWNLNGVVEIHDIGYLQVTLRLDLSGILGYFSLSGLHPHGGLITMGDHNVQSNGTALLGYYDQLSICREPIKDDWLIGKARGELPWFGLVKLWATGGLPQHVPQNSVTNLVVTIVLVIGLPIALDMTNVLLKRRGIEIFGWTKRLSLRRLLHKQDDAESKEVEKDARQDAASSKQNQAEKEKEGKEKTN